MAFPGAFLAVLEFPNSWLKLPLHFTSWFPEDVAPRGIRLGKLRYSEKRGSEETGSKNKQESQSGQHTVSEGQHLRKRRRAKDRKHTFSSWSQALVFAAGAWRSFPQHQLFNRPGMVTILLWIELRTHHNMKMVFSVILKLQESIREVEFPCTRQAE